MVEFLKEEKLTR